MRRRAAFAFVVAAVVVLSCAGRGRAPSTSRRASPHGPSVAPGAALGEYTLRYDGEEIVAEAKLRVATGPGFVVESGADEFIRDAESAPGIDGTAFEPMKKTGETFQAFPCQRGPCRVRYRFALLEAAKSADDLDIASQESGAIESPPSSWILAPADPPHSSWLRFRMTTSDGVKFATGVFPSREVPDAWDITLDDLWTSPYSMFGPLRLRTIEVEGSPIQIALAPGKLALDDDKIAAWVENAGRALATYLGRFPMARALVILVPSGGRWVGGGRTLAGGGGSVFMRLGERAPPAAYANDWVIVHEMMHLGFPSVPRAHNWAEEGIATYVEPFARVRGGLLKEDEAWRGLVEGLPNGLPKTDDGGLDHTPTWGRVYWGGALFWLLVDIEIRRATKNQKGLEHALRGMLEAGMNNAKRYTMDDVVAAGDKATGTTAMHDLYEAMKAAPHPVDLDALFAELGVRIRGGKVVFDDKAPLASIRKAITTGTP